MVKSGHRRCLGCFAKRSLWVPTWKGWLLLLFLGGVGAFGFVKGIHPFLAVNAPVPAQVMVVEGWIPMTALEAAAEKFRAGGYEMLCTVGGPESGEDPTGLRNDAVIVADQFLEMGLPPKQIFAVPSGAPLRDRTFTGAKVLHDWFLQRGELPAGLNVVTEGLHSRRSRLLFEKAFGHEVEVGVISLADRDYEAERWWRYSEGVKEVMSEGAAYLYARFFF